MSRGRNDTDSPIRSALSSLRSDQLHYSFLISQLPSLLSPFFLVVLVPHFRGRCNNKKKQGKKRQRPHRLGQGGDNSGL